MKLTAAHEPPGDVRRLQFGTFRRRMGSEITGDGDEDGVADLAGPSDRPRREVKSKRAA